MFEKFDEVMFEVGAKYGMNKWYDIFDSEVFDEVENEIFARYGNNPRGYRKWVKEMAEDL